MRAKKFYVVKKIKSRYGWWLQKELKKEKMVDIIQQFPTDTNDHLEISKKCSPFSTNVPLLYSLKISEKPPVLWCVQGVSKWNIKNLIGRANWNQNLFNPCFDYRRYWKDKQIAERSDFHKLLRDKHFRWITQLKK